MNTGDWIRKWAMVRPNKTAVISEGREYTYREVNDRVNQLAHALIALGVGKGDRVAAILFNCSEFMEVYFALAKLGGIFVPMNFRLAGRELDYQLKDSGAKILIFDQEVGPVVDSIRSSIGIQPGNYICVGESAPSWATGYEELLTGGDSTESEVGEEVDLGDPQMIMYTSGTTGTPKGALLSHRKTFYNTLNAQIYFDLTSRDVMLVVMPLFHSGGLNIAAVPALYCGATIVILRRFDAEDVLQTIQDYGVTCTMMVPTTFNLILKEVSLDQYDLGSLRCCLAGGEPMSASIIEEYNRRNIPVRQVFGQTETSIELWVPAEDAVRKAGSVGRPVMHSEVRVLNKRGGDVRPGEVGEISLKGPIQMIGYWNDPERTREVMRDGWLHTGDLATVDEEGHVYMVDRERDMYISGGENVYPAEVEKLYAANTKILEVAVIGVPDEKWGEVGKAIIALKRGESMTEEEALNFCQGKIARYKIPKSVEFVEELPKTASGKIKKVVLREKYGGRRPLAA